MLLYFICFNIYCFEKFIKIWDYLYIEYSLKNKNIYYMKNCINKLYYIYIKIFWYKIDY